MPGGTVMARELAGDDRRMRAAGMDWPRHGLTMVGLDRLDDVQACVEAIVEDGVAGDLIEAGTWRGGAALLMRATLDTRGDERTVWVADSFQGFPASTAPDDGAMDLRPFDFLAVAEDEVRESFARLGCDRGVRVVPGFFEDTLSALASERWALVRLDADSYEATHEALRWLYPGLAVGGYLIVDDYGSFAGCQRAVDEFRAEHAITEAIEKVDFTGVRWRRESATPIATPAPPPARERPAPAVAVPASDDVPTVRELELTGEVAELRQRLAAAEAQIGLRAALRRRWPR